LSREWQYASANGRAALESEVEDVLPQPELRPDQNNGEVYKAPNAAFGSALISTARFALGFPDLRVTPWVIAAQDRLLSPSAFNGDKHIFAN
jgi:hypothetical protein